MGAAILSLAEIQNHRTRVCSQIDEDGVLEYIFKQIGTITKLFVEIGVAPSFSNDDRKGKLEGNAVYLRSQGWLGWLIDAVKQDDELGINKYFVSPDNINALLESLGCPVTFDLFSLDIDSLEYYVMKEFLKKFKPRVVVCEYNCLYQDKRVISRLQDQNWADDRFGVSGQLLKELMNDNCYVMVHTNRANAIFVHAQELTDECVKEFEPLEPEYYDSMHRIVSKKEDWVIFK